MMALTQTSKISVKNSLIASSVCGLVGLFAIKVLLLLEPEVGGMEVNGAKGGKAPGAGENVGAVFGGWGRWRRRNLVDVGVKKQEIWEFENWSMRLRYLRLSVSYREPYNYYNEVGSQVLSKL